MNEIKELEESIQIAAKELSDQIDQDVLDSYIELTEMEEVVDILNAYGRKEHTPLELYYLLKDTGLMKVRSIAPSSAVLRKTSKIIKSYITEIYGPDGKESIKSKRMLTPSEIMRLPIFSDAHSFSPQNKGAL